MCKHEFLLHDFCLGVGRVTFYIIINSAYECSHHTKILQSWVCFIVNVQYICMHIHVYVCKIQWVKTIEPQNGAWNTKYDEQSVVPNWHVVFVSHQYLNRHINKYFCKSKYRCMYVHLRISLYLLLCIYIEKYIYSMVVSGSPKRW